jgi:hypothetical protein
MRRRVSNRAPFEIVIKAMLANPDPRGFRGNM